MKRPQSSTLPSVQRSRSRPVEFHGLAEGKVPRSGRVTLDLNAEAIANLDALKKSLGDATNTEAIRQALRHHNESLSFSNVQEPTATPSSSGDRLLSARLLVRNRREIINYTEVLIEALQEALDYDPLRNHNSGPPPLFSDDKNYLSDIAALTKELKKLNKLLQSTTQLREKSKSAKQVETYVHLFMSQYAPHLGKGAAYLTVGAMGALLHSLESV
jgi:hypothetical protein